MFNEFLYICWKSRQYKQWNYISKNTKWFVHQNSIPPIEDKMIVILTIVENKMVDNIAILKVDVITMIWLTVTGYLCHTCFVCVITIRFFPHAWLITGFVTKVTRDVSIVEQELLTLPKLLSSSPVIVGFVLLDRQCNCSA